jgi:hypothetical protein
MVRVSAEAIPAIANAEQAPSRTVFKFMIFLPEEK